MLPCNCIADVATEKLRDTIQTENSSSNWSTTFVFNLAETIPQNDVHRVILRSYIQVNHIHAKNSTSITATVSIRLQNGTFKTIATIGLQLPTSGGWKEFDITRGMKEVLFAGGINYPIEFVVSLSPLKGLKIEATLANPASLPVQQRKNIIGQQTLLILHLADPALKRKMSKFESEVNLSRSKMTREVYPEACKIRNFTINFSNIGLNYVLIPYSFNARKCEGLCSPPYYKGVDDVSNYALLINGAKVAQDGSNLTGSENLPPAESPCCVPTKYSPQILTTQHRDGSIRTEFYGDMMVETCGCR